MAASVGAPEAFAEAGIEVVAFSVDDEEATKGFVEKRELHFRPGHSADLETVMDETGADDRHHPVSCWRRTEPW